MLQTVNVQEDYLGNLNKIEHGFWTPEFFSRLLAKTDLNKLSGTFPSEATNLLITKISKSAENNQYVITAIGQKLVDKDFYEDVGQATDLTLVANWDIAKLMTTIDVTLLATIHGFFTSNRIVYFILPKMNLSSYSSVTSVLSNNSLAANEMPIRQDDLLSIVKNSSLDLETKKNETSPNQLEGGESEREKGKLSELNNKDLSEEHQSYKTPPFDPKRYLDFPLEENKKTNSHRGYILPTCNLF